MRASRTWAVEWPLGLAGKATGEHPERAPSDLRSGPKWRARAPTGILLCMSDPQTSRRKPAKKGPSLAPLYGAIGIAILAIVAVALAKNKQKEHDDAQAGKGSPTEQAANPFDEVLNQSKASGKTTTGTPSPEGLLSDPKWLAALTTGEQAMAKLKVARDADEAGDRAKYKKLAVEARDLFDKALDDTAEWELTLVDTHGEGDPRVAKILAQRNLWNAARKKLRKVDVNDL